MNPSNFFDKLTDSPYKYYKKTWDEMFEKSNRIRPGYRFLYNYLSKQSVEEINKLKDFSMKFFMNQGITFNLYSEKNSIEKIFPFDIIPRIIKSKDWDIIEKGLIQRITALNLFLKDIYNEQFIIKDRVFPIELVSKNPYFINEMRAFSPPKDIYTHVSGVDLIRDQHGDFYVLEDNLRTPSGVCYMLENRQISKRIYPTIMPKRDIRDVSNYPQILYKQLSSLSDKNNPTVALLTPGMYNSAYYEHSTLARLMGVELVEGRDLVMLNNNVLMKTSKGLEKIDVLYRRVDDDFLDPIAFNQESILGVPGILKAYKDGNIIIANSPGTGVADDKATYIYVPKIIQYYLNEEPILKNLKTLQLNDPDQFDIVKKKIENYVIKKTDGSGGYGMLMGNSADENEIEIYFEKIKKNPSNFIAQPILNLSTSPCILNDTLEPRCVDFRPFAIYGSDGIKVCPGGLTRVALKKNSLVVNSSQGGGSKDTWII